MAERERLGYSTVELNPDSRAQTHYEPMFTQRFLVEAPDLGTSLATSFSSP